ncbi:MAG TPA: flagellar basal body L-ring protein FlgH [Janthinobacterium sp.]|jgi:flagellar L-ring protein precursor FlgH|nr:flagellar basal body L-ring protein FlgH [Janthinobacterium sp.]
MKTTLTAALLLQLVLLSGCAALAPPPGPKPSAVELTPPRSTARPGVSGGVFAPDSVLSLISDSRAFRVGDVVTVTLQETTQASKAAATTFSKTSDLALTPLTIAGKGMKTDVNVTGKRDFNGNATSSQQNALTGAITVVVEEVLPSGLLKVSGEKTLVLNQGEELLRLRGYLRAADIDSSNQVSSQRIANAHIDYAGQGTLADANTAGWLTRFFNGPWMPF